MVVLGQRQRQDGEAVFGTRVDGGRFEPVQMVCNLMGSSVAANPLDRSVNPIPAWVAWRLAHSCPLIQMVAG